jgi:hypothetical protein
MKSPPTLVSDLADATLLAELAERLARSAKPATDWVAAYSDGELLRSDEAGIVAGLSAETIRRRCSESFDIGQPIGVHFAGVWLISARRLLADIEDRNGLPERLAAESRAEKLLKTRLAPQLSPQIVAPATR